jgi:hypothetical protein
MKKITSKIINTEEIKHLFEEFIQNNKVKKYTKKDFRNFLNFLEIDFYDWVRGNLRSYFKNS